MKSQSVVVVESTHKGARRRCRDPPIAHKFRGWSFRRVQPLFGLAARRPSATLLSPTHHLLSTLLIVCPACRAATDADTSLTRFQTSSSGLRRLPRRPLQEQEQGRARMPASSNACATGRRARKMPWTGSSSGDYGPRTVWRIVRLVCSCCSTACRGTDPFGATQETLRTRTRRSPTAHLRA